jgi:hypothetical protein
MPERHTFVLFTAGWLGERRKALARISGCSYVGLGVLAALSPGSSSSAHELMQ